ncbi:hypothetical protein R1flu_011602 [Riccia fluitans]|uniref:Uncharacterized protein n=1 Tax=Riccia fluitans TaxID=41844 RepID=A0ABD1Z952_9MARC
MSGDMIHLNGTVKNFSPFAGFSRSTLSLLDDENISAELAALLPGYESVLAGVRSSKFIDSSNDLEMSVEGYDGPFEITEEEGNRDAYLIDNSFNDLEISMEVIGRL